MRIGAAKRLWCDLSHKNSKIKANHNEADNLKADSAGVIYHTKIVKSRQITTRCHFCYKDKKV